VATAAPAPKASLAVFTSSEPCSSRPRATPNRYAMDLDLLDLLWAMPGLVAGDYSIGSGEHVRVNFGPGVGGRPLDLPEPTG
jgi:hypothetical protein